MKGFFAKYYSLIFIVLLAAIVIIAFYVGMLYGHGSQKSGVELRCSDDMLSALRIPLIERSEAKEVVKSDAAQGKFGGSKNGTKYYTPGCAGLERIKPENLVWFQTEEDARLQGYTQASC